MAWKDIYDPTEKRSTKLVAKVPSSSIYYNNPDVLVKLHQGIRPTDSPDLMFGNGTLIYKNTGSHETLQIYVFLQQKLFAENTNVSIDINFDYNKKTKMYDYRVAPSMGSEEASNYVRERLDFPKGTVKHVYASDVGDDIFGFIKKIILDVQKALFEHIKIYENKKLEFEINYAEELEKLKSYVASRGLRLHLGDSTAYGKVLALIDDNAGTKLTSKIEFVSSPCGLFSSQGTLENFLNLFNYTTGYSSEPKYKFKSPEDMFEFIKTVTVQYFELRSKFKDVHEQFRANMKM